MNARRTRRWRKGARPQKRPEQNSPRARFRSLAQNRWSVAEDATLQNSLSEGIQTANFIIPIINFGLVRDPKVVLDTVHRMELLKVASGGYRRVRSTYTDPAIYEYWYEREEFLFVDLSLAELERRLGNNVEADAMLKRIVNNAAADHDIIPEMYVALPCTLFPGKIGDPTGALPMVGYGAGAYILHVLERKEFEKAR